ncbi:NUDIX hydrolase [Periweissella fabalis]|uniref:NUDIX domain-containing protein n=1 Tax=Periweissella fabalis TaxID=1070421 RepID=A0A7X6S2J3_9LACO|nr:NUDIX domain-containing protein [Periweissella fabalis]MCM0599304.1 NUDIX domain-containing protein [Periweissella fabalis]NKZ23583.1 NUDIX domain-containing protein [Periweissella fabalis]
MKVRYQTPSAVFALMFSPDGTQILLQKRQNTGYQDGAYDLAATGHVEAGETLPQALCRELNEELGITVLPGQLEFATMIHKHDRDTDKVYFNGYFKVLSYDGIPQVMEPHKNAGLSWWPISQLPATLIGDRKLALEQYAKGIPYSELGW